jgi:Organic solute transporter Ostalpha
VNEYFEAALCPRDPYLIGAKLSSLPSRASGPQSQSIAVIAYERRMKHHLQGHRPTAKLFTFKLIVLIEAAQNTIFKILTSSEVFKPTYHISVYDFSVGIPAFMLCCEMLVLSSSFWWSYSFGP